MEEKRKRVRKEREEKAKEYLGSKTQEWHPSENPKATEDAFKTLFVGRIVRSAFVQILLFVYMQIQAFETTEKELLREFERYGPVKNVVVEGLS